MKSPTPLICSQTAMNSFQSIVFSYLYNKKAKQLVLWLIWLWGFILIGVSFYATQHMPLTSSLKSQIKKSMLLNGELVDGPTITIFTAPKPFVGTTGERQALAIQSWLGLLPDISVVLFSQDPSVFSFAELLSHRVSVEPNIDFTFLGTPFFHSMVARSKASSSDVSVVIDPNTILLSDFIKTIRHAHRLDHDWLLFSSSKSVPHFPFHLDADGKHWLQDDGNRVKTQKLQDFLSQERKWNLCEGKMLIAWNNGDLPLHKGVLPPFLYGKGLHNRWLINEALFSDFRFVFDASWAISNLYLNDFDQDFNCTSEDFLGLATRKRFWEAAGNSNLAMLYGSLYFHEQNFSNIFRLFQCGGHYLFINSAQMVVYPLRYKGSLSLRKEVMFKSTREKNTLECIDTIRSTEGAKDCPVKDYLNVSMPISLSLSLELLLSLRADSNKTVVLAVVGYSYKDMLMSWVCRLHHLQISNFLVCALDDDIYDFSVLQGLPVFKFANLEIEISFDNCHFGTECFQKVTKVKSRMVLQILKLGYNVLMSDVDIYWFKNPLPFLSSFGPAVLVAQSDEYKLTGPINLPRRLNSGFYYAHSDAMTIAALKKVVKHAANSNLSEQPSFYDTLCGEGGYNRIDDRRCLEPQTNLTVQFLDRDLFPNGAYKDLWQERNVEEACLMKGCFIIHNNWISGRRKKLERQVPSGLWEYDMSTRMCLQTWHKTKYVYF
ncbi:beta-arabinofuranosyltransferase RAY1 isoform X2 [Capsicum galapagoense]